MYISLYFPRHCSGFGLMMMFRICGTAWLSGCYGKRVHMQSVGGERNAYKCSFLWLVQYRTRDKCPSFCCKDFFVTFFELQNHAYVYLQFSISLCYTYSMWHARQCRCLNHNQSWKVLGLLCAKLCGSAYSSMATRINLKDWDITELVLQSDYKAHSSEDKDISGQNDSDSDTDNDTDDVSDTNFT